MLVPSHYDQMLVFGRDLIRRGHYGQQSCEPKLKAEHMAASTNAAHEEHQFAAIRTAPGRQ